MLSKVEILLAYLTLWEILSKFNRFLWCHSLFLEKLKFTYTFKAQNMLIKFLLLTAFFIHFSASQYPFMQAVKGCWWVGHHTASLMGAAQKQRAHWRLAQWSPIICTLRFLPEVGEQGTTSNSTTYHLFILWWGIVNVRSPLGLNTSRSRFTPWFCWGVVKEAVARWGFVIWYQVGEGAWWRASQVDSSCLW